MLFIFAFPKDSTVPLCKWSCSPVLSPSKKYQHHLSSELYQFSQKSGNDDDDDDDDDDDNDDRY